MYFFGPVIGGGGGGGLISSSLWTGMLLRKHWSVLFFSFFCFGHLWTKPKTRIIDLQKKDKTNVFPKWTEQASSIRFYYIGFPTCCFLVCVKLVYAQAVLEKIFSYLSLNSSIGKMTSSCLS